MTKEERKLVKDLKRCDFSLIAVSWGRWPTVLPGCHASARVRVGQAHYNARAEARKAAGKEEKEERKKAEAKIRVRPPSGRPGVSRMVLVPPCSLALTWCLRR